MQDFVPKGDWSMAAVIGLEDEKVDELCKNITKGFVVPANYNCPGQVVVSGEKAGIEEVIEKAKEFGAKRAIELKTSGPFHTSKLEEASKRLRNELEKIDFKVTDKKVIKNIDAKEYTENDDIREILDEKDPLTILMTFSGDPIADLQPLLDLFKQLENTLVEVDRQIANRKAKLGEIQDYETGANRYANEFEAIDECIALLGRETQV